MKSKREKENPLLKICRRRDFRCDRMHVMLSLRDENSVHVAHTKIVVIVVLKQRASEQAGYVERRRERVTR